MDMKVVERPKIDIVFNTKDMKTIWDILTADIPAPFNMVINLHSLITSKYIKEVNPWSTFKLTLQKKSCETCDFYSGHFYIAAPTGNEEYPQNVYSFTAFSFPTRSCRFIDLINGFAESLDKEDNKKTIMEGSIKAFNSIISIKYNFSDHVNIVCDMTGFSNLSLVNYIKDPEHSAKIVQMS